MSAQVTPPPRSWKRRILRYLGLAGGTYLGIVIVLLALENSFVYHPTTAAEDWQPLPDADVQDVDLLSADGTRIHGWWLPRKGATGAVLFFHGNAGNLSQRGGTVVLLRERLGESVLVVDYPGFGKSGGRPSESGCYAAADAAYDWLTKSQLIPGNRVILYGASLGGGVAVDLASRRNYRALILVSTFTSVPDAGAEHFPWLPVRWLMRNRFDSLAKIAKCQGPVFIAQGTADTLTPFHHGERLFEAAREPKKFCPMPGAGHEEVMSELCFKEFSAFLRDTAP
jgi:fermentation-respiration switch protein FrsA (DUF1100 family)